MTKFTINSDLLIDYVVMSLYSTRYLNEFLCFGEPLFPHRRLGCSESELCPRVHVVDDEVLLLRVHVRSHGDVLQLWSHTLHMDQLLTVQ